MAINTNLVSCKKLLITGLGRSGTSAVASFVHGLGYHMPFAKELATNEDVKLRTLLEAGDVTSIKKELESRAVKYPLVAWKDPKLFGIVGEKLLDLLDKDWVYLVVFRDPVSVAVRNNKSLGRELDSELLNATTQQLKLALFYIKLKVNRRVHLVSYEKFITVFEKTADDMLSFLGLTCEKDDLANLQLFVRGDHERYLAAQPVSFLSPAKHAEED